MLILRLAGAVIFGVIALFLIVVFGLRPLEGLAENTEPSASLRAFWDGATVVGVICAVASATQVAALSDARFRVHARWAALIALGGLVTLAAWGSAF